MVELVYGSQNSILWSTNLAHEAPPVEPELLVEEMPGALLLDLEVEHRRLGLGQAAVNSAGVGRVGGV